MYKLTISEKVVMSTSQKCIKLLNITYLWLLFPERTHKATEHGARPKYSFAYCSNSLHWISMPWRRHFSHNWNPARQGDRQKVRAYQVGVPSRQRWRVGWVLSSSESLNPLRTKLTFAMWHNTATQCTYQHPNVTLAYCLC